jgi:hypothetical protein
MLTQIKNFRVFCTILQFVLLAHYLYFVWLEQEIKEEKLNKD